MGGATESGGVPAPCRSCGARWQRTELMSEARHGGGYRVRCHECGHEWDDPKASHAERENASRVAAANRADIQRPEGLLMEAQMRRVARLGRYKLYWAARSGFVYPGLHLWTGNRHVRVLPVRKTKSR